MIEWIGWLGVAFGLGVGPSQLIKLLKTKGTTGISKWTYIYLNCALLCYLIYAIHIHNAVFITAHSISLVVNGTVLYLILRYRRGRP